VELPKSEARCEHYCRQRGEIGTLWPRLTSRIMILDYQEQASRGDRGEIYARHSRARDEGKRASDQISMTSWLPGPSPLQNVASKMMLRRRSYLSQPARTNIGILDRTTVRKFGRNERGPERWEGLFSGHPGHAGPTSRLRGSPATCATVHTGLELVCGCYRCCSNDNKVLVTKQGVPGLNSSIPSSSASGQEEA